MQWITKASLICFFYEYVNTFGGNVLNDMANHYQMLPEDCKSLIELGRKYSIEFHKGSKPAVMNTILITGTSSMPNGTNGQVHYDIQLWGSKVGDNLQFIRADKLQLDNYNTLWDWAKNKASAYFHNTRFIDGGYTQFLDHLILK